MAGSGDSVPGLPEPGGRGPVVLDGMRVLRLCSVFEPAALSGRSAGYDAIGGMQNHTAELSLHLDKMGAVQLVLTSRLDSPAGTCRSCGPGWTRGWPGRHGRSWPPRWHSAAPRLTWCTGTAGKTSRCCRWPGWRRGGTTAPGRYRPR